MKRSCVKHICLFCAANFHSATRKFSSVIALGVSKNHRTSTAVRGWLVQDVLGRDRFACPVSRLAPLSVGFISFPYWTVAVTKLIVRCLSSNVMHGRG